MSGGPLAHPPRTGANDPPCRCVCFATGRTRGRPTWSLPEDVDVTQPLIRRGAAALASIGALLAAPALAAQAPDSAAFVTRLGNDTLAVERVVRTPRRVEAEVLLRTPRATITRYALELDERGELRRFEAVTRDAGADAGAAPTRR